MYYRRAEGPEELLVWPRGQTGRRKHNGEALNARETETMT